MYPALLMVHSLLRWLVLAALVLRVGRSLQAAMSGAAWDRIDRALSGAALGFTHLQVVLGVGMYLLSPKVAQGLGDMGVAMKETALRFWVVEHPFTMVLGAIAVQLGFSLSKRATVDSTRHRIALAGFGIGLLLILAGIPWTFRGAL